jgi:hypothetical protein
MKNKQNLESCFKCKRFVKLFWSKMGYRMLFKKLKSRYFRDVLETKNVQIIEAPIWTAMLMLIVTGGLIQWSKLNSSSQKNGQTCTVASE